MKFKMIALFMVALILSIPVVTAVQINFVYDANGNVVYDGDTFREYNSLNQLSKVFNGSDNTTLLAEYVFHPVEERVLMKKVYDAGVWKETIYYVSDSFVSKKNASGIYNETYVMLNGQKIAQVVNGETEFIHSDNLGSSSLITNSSGGLVEHTTYSPYGDIINGGNESRFDYTGQEYEDNTGHYDYDARQVKPEYGIFTQPDRLVQDIFDPQSLNRYMYVRGNPYIFVDPTGRNYVYLLQEDGAANQGHAAGIVYNDEYAAYYSQMADSDVSNNVVGQVMIYEGLTVNGGAEYKEFRTIGDYSAIEQLMDYYSGEIYDKYGQTTGETEMSKYDSFLEFETSIEQDDDMIMKMREFADDPAYDRYNLYLDNCGLRQANIMSSGGLTSSSNIRPNSQFARISRFNRNDRNHAGERGSNFVKIYRAKTGETEIKHKYFKE